MTLSKKSYGHIQSASSVSFPQLGLVRSVTDITKLNLSTISGALQNFIFLL